MPGAPAEGGTSPPRERWIVTVPAEVPPGSALSVVSFTEKIERECDPPARGAAEITKNSQKRPGLCSFQQACVWLLGECHPGFRKGARGRTT